jgi:type VI secretion system protein ImpL
MRNSWQWQTLKYSSGFAGLMTFYGVVGFITMYVLPSMGIANSRTVQFAIVAGMIVLTLPIALVGMLISSRRAKKARRAEEAAAAEASGEGAAKTAAETAAAPAGSAAAVVPAGLAEGAEEVVQFLKTSNLGSDGKDAVHTLPWYLIAGDAKAGKSSFVIGSNLNVQTLPSQRLAEQKFVRPTKLVDWRVTSDGVFIDAAGKHFADSSGSADEWNALLDTIKKYRSQRPIDGFVLIVNAAKILSADEREAEELAKTLRTRLDEVITRYKIKFPVYLVFTNADCIEGFRDSFSTSKKEDKTLVWGATIPIDKSDNAQALFDAEYEILLNSLMKRRITRLSAPFPPVRQLRIFNFPLHFGSARRKFSSFVNALFRPNPFSENPFLRGFYFTSSPVGKAVGNAPPSVGNTYFTERLMRDVILRDKDLTRTFLDHKKRAPIMGWVVTFLGALLVGVLLLMSGISLASNRKFLKESEEIGQAAMSIRQADSERKSILDKNESETRSELDAIENLREQLKRIDGWETEGRPLTMRFGLYSGAAIRDRALKNLYDSMIEKRFKDPAVAKLTADLQAFVKTSNTKSSSEAELSKDDELALTKQFNRLAVYLMLSGEYRQQANATLIEQVLGEYWVSESKVPASDRQLALDQLQFWAQHANDPTEGKVSPGIKLDEKLVEAARNKFKSEFPPVYRYYSKIVAETSKAVEDAGDVMNVDGILMRAGITDGLMTGSATVPGAYTRAGIGMMTVAIDNAATEIGKQNWVMGDKADGQSVVKTTDVAWLRERYYRDYSDQWRRFVRGVSVKPYPKEPKSAVSDALMTFSSNKSPMTAILEEIAKNTNLSEKPVAAGWIDWLKGLFTSAGSQEKGQVTQVEKDFRPLFDFVGSAEEKSPPLSKYGSTIGKLQKDVNKKVNQLDEVAKKLAKGNDDDLKIGDAENSINSNLGEFKSTPAGQDLATLILQPITRLRELLGADARSQMQKEWADKVLPAARAIEGGYPFGGGASDADLAKVTEFLNPETGILSKFYEESLARYFEESNGELKVAANSEIEFSDEFVAYLNNAFTIRKALFGTSATPKFAYEFTLKPASGALVEITIDGQKVTNEGTGSIQGVFPASGSAETGVIVTLASAGGATTGGTPGAGGTGTPAASDPQSLKFAGNWGLFKFVDKGNPQKQAGGEYLLSYSVGGKGVSATIKPSGGDLFDKGIFAKFKAPDSFGK